MYVESEGMVNKILERNLIVNNWLIKNGSLHGALPYWIVLVIIYYDKICTYDVSQTELFDEDASPQLCKWLCCFRFSIQVANKFQLVYCSPLKI